MFPVSPKCVAGLSILAMSLVPVFAQGIVEDSLSAQTTPSITTTMDEEGSRFVSTPPIYSQLKSKAAGGTAAFFLAVGVDLTSTAILLSNPPQTPEELIPYLAVSVGVGACVMSSVPATCAQASGAVDAFRDTYGFAPSNPVWKLYGAGWACYGLGQVFNLVGTYGEAPEAALIGSVIGLGGSVLWGIACIRSITFINELGEKASGRGNDGRISLSLTPVVGPRGMVGASLSGSF